MGYVTVNVREDDLINGIFVKGGSGFRGGDFLFHLHEEDFRRGVYVKGLRVYGKIVPFTWTDGSTNYQASSFVIADDSNRVGVEQYGGTKEQFLHHKAAHAVLCHARGKEQEEFVHFPAESFSPDF